MGGLQFGDDGQADAAAGRLRSGASSPEPLKRCVGAIAAAALASPCSLLTKVAKPGGAKCATTVAEWLTGTDGRSDLRYSGVRLSRPHSGLPATMLEEPS